MKKALLAGALALAPSVALAHPAGFGHAHGLAEGFAHPFGGADHVLAMVAVGLLAAQIGGRALWAVPAAFLGAMAAGGALAASGVQLPLFELGIGLSVVILGAAVAFGGGLTTAVAAAIAGLFAIFHGFAHGAEASATTSWLGYGAGFVLATGLLHVAGIGVGVAASRFDITSGRRLVRLAGAAIGAVGAVLLSGAV
jgi:urease accessory protein